VNQSLANFPSMLVQYPQIFPFKESDEEGEKIKGDEIKQRGKAKGDRHRKENRMTKHGRKNDEQRRKESKLISYKRMDGDGFPKQRGREVTLKERQNEE